MTRMIENLLYMIFLALFALACVFSAALGVTLVLVFPALLSVFAVVAAPFAPALAVIPLAGPRRRRDDVGPGGEGR